MASPLRPGGMHFDGPTMNEAAAGARFAAFMMDGTKARGKKPPERAEYPATRPTFFTDPALNTQLKTSDIPSHFDAAAEDARHWQSGKTGGTWARERRFPKGRTMTDQRVLHKPAERFYNVDKGHGVKKRVRPLRSVWPRAETPYGSMFSEREGGGGNGNGNGGGSSAGGGPRNNNNHDPDDPNADERVVDPSLSVEWANPHPDTWKVKEVCGTVQVGRSVVGQSSVVARCGCCCVSPTPACLPACPPRVAGWLAGMVRASGQAAGATTHTLCVSLARCCVSSLAAVCRRSLAACRSARPCSPRRPSATSSDTTA